MTRVFVVPRKVTGKEWVAGMPGLKSIKKGKQVSFV